MIFNINRLKTIQNLIFQAMNIKKTFKFYFYYIFLIIPFISCDNQKEFVIKDKKISNFEIFYVEKDILSITNLSLFESIEYLEKESNINEKKCLIRGEAFSNIKKILQNNDCKKVIIESPYISLEEKIFMDNKYNFLKRYELIVIADSIDNSNIPIQNALQILDKYPKTKLLIPIGGDSFTFWIHKKSYLKFIYQKDINLKKSENTKNSSNLDFLFEKLDTFKQKTICFNDKYFQIFSNEKSLKNPPFLKYSNCYSNMLITEITDENYLFWRRFLNNYKNFKLLLKDKSRTDSILFWVEKREQETQSKHIYYNNILDFFYKELYKDEPYLKKELLWQTSTK
ncbi:hypothetical protein JXR93_13480 [bacterium]|nr:hypothetical protein [bacterium]